VIPYPVFAHIEPTGDIVNGEERVFVQRILAEGTLGRLALRGVYWRGGLRRSVLYETDSRNSLWRGHIVSEAFSQVLL
jgi:hypothetical protein